jgi:hypothetical protein
MRIPLLAIGTVLGYGLFFGSMFHRRHHRHDAWEHHIADVCVGAASRMKGDSQKADPAKTEKASPKTEPSEP